MRCDNTANMLNHQLMTFFGFVLIVAASDVISGSSCPQDYTLLSSENVCFRFSGVARSRSDAEHDCSSTSGGHLATIDGTSETVEDLVDLAWIAMDYVTKLPANYVWVRQQEDECQVLSIDDNWSVIPYDCQAQLPYICQTDVPGALDNFYEVDYERSDSSEDSSSNVRLRRATRKRLRKCTASREVCRRLMALRRARIARLRARIARRRARKGRKPANACSASRQPLHETDRSGTIVSPKYPNTYPKHSYCQWLIDSQGANRVIQLTVTSFTTVGYFDYLYIYDGHNDSATLMATMTGHYIETMQFYSSGRYMFVRFEATSNSLVDVYGFMATYILTGCNGGGFLCSSTRKCLAECHVCDGVNDCGDNSDESDCGTITVCPVDWYRCSDTGVCIPPCQRCNGRYNCPDGNDEHNCTSSRSCEPDQFKCNNGVQCISSCGKCDGYGDCNDGSDEYDCQCDSDEFTCIGEGVCIGSYLRCDDSCDCDDCSDEINCTVLAASACLSAQFQCASTGGCIPLAYRCDGVTHCMDGGDEANCVGVCAGRGYQCDDGWCLSTTEQCQMNYCRPNQFLCDGYQDCPDKSDELNCTTTRTTVNPACDATTHFECKHYGCIPIRMRCDLDYDCIDASDEKNCHLSPSCSGLGDYQCDDGLCVHLFTWCTLPWCSVKLGWNFRCDGYQDCPDNSDELNCSEIAISKCGPGQFECKGNVSTGLSCIPQHRWCNGNPDCSDGSDEIDCLVVAECAANRFRCKNGQCVKVYSYCQGYSYCSDHSDQSNCTCGDQEFQCASTYKCIRQCKVCDGRRDCVDGSDEFNCTCDATTHFECQSGECIPICKRCDMGFDCADRSDEYNCPSRCPATNQFQCAYGGRCLSSCSRCDGRSDCDDGSDEFNCTVYRPCDPDSFRCSDSGKCYPSRKLCDGYCECSDCSDEYRCKCTEEQIRCSSGRCIPSYTKCNSYCDCEDCSDERNCQCTKKQMRCPSGRCIPSSWKCDLACGCEDCSDERNCPCQFRCKNTRCYSSKQRCDGINNCGDYTDEIGCDECHSYNEFSCSNGLCLGISAECDGVRDCLDGSDERPNCAQSCRSNEFSCTNGRCVNINSRCNEMNDCGDFSDEIDCYCNVGPKKFRCKMGMCILEDKWCDGYTDCPDNSDEISGCAGTCPTNSTGSRICEPLGKCIFASKVCNGVQDCPDDSDEVNCTCRYGLYGCLNGRCIHEQFLCDGVKDCPLGDDESPSLCHQCGDTEFQCVRATNTCISAAQRCDGVPQCPDFSDESHCFAVNSSTNLLIVNYKGDTGYFVCGDSSFPTAFSDVICRELGHGSSTLTKVVNISSSGNTNWLSLSPNTDTSSPVLLSLQQSTCATNVAVVVRCSELQCGRRSANISNVGAYIIGGQWALRGAWPWQVMLKVDGWFYCGGSLINDRWILTAAHCTRKGGSRLQPSRYSIRLGSVLAMDSDADLVVSDVDKVITNPTYDSDASINDVGLLRLEQPVVFTDTIRPICLPAMDVNLKKFKVCVDTGFRVNGNDEGRLLQIRMNIMSASDCNEVLNVLFPNSADLSIYNDTVICLGQEPFEGDGICSRDSGGPLACQDHQGSWSVIGVNSFGGPDACYQGFAARLPTYVDWIQQTIAENS